jgi:predicted glycoside hydrolase/deacetylase ChbG (UPF0249 family)
VEDNQTAEPAVAASEPTPRPIWLCADDYGISVSVNRAIRDLVVKGRINASSVMVVAPSFTRSEAASLRMLNAGTRRVAIGLHVTLTGPFRPLSAGFRPVKAGTFLPLEQMLARAAARLLDRERLTAEIAAQLDSFVTVFGAPPDFIDGHQHVQLFPQVRDALLQVVKDAAPGIWVRQCGAAVAPSYREAKARVLDRLSRTCRRRAAAQGIRTNPAFAGAYNFKNPPGDMAKLFAGFLDRLPADGVVMCHPGVVDDELARLDPLTQLREREYWFLSDDAFPDLLRAHGVALAAPDPAADSPKVGA